MARVQVLVGYGVTIAGRDTKINQKQLLVYLAYVSAERPHFAIVNKFFIGHALPPFGPEVFHDQIVRKQDATCKRTRGDDVLERKQARDVWGRGPAF